MNKRIILVTGLALIHSFTALFAQAPEVDSKKIIQKGVDFHDNKKFEEAIAEFKKVDRNDTNYVLAALELANTYITDGKDSLAVFTCDQLLDMPSSFGPNILLYKANALDNMKKSDEAEKVYQEGIKKYPMNNSFYYELGILKYKQEKYKEANDLFVKSIRCNPFHAASHLQMGNLAIKQGKLIPVMLAWQFYLLIDNSSDLAKSVVTELERMSRNEYEFKDAIKIPELSEQDDFSELESLVKSKVALGSKYKSKIDLNFNITKQLQLIFDKISVNKEDKGFYMQFYATIFSELEKKKLFEPYAYSILGGMGNKEVDSWLRKNKKDIDELSIFLVNYIGENFSTYEATLNGKQVVARHWYYNNKISSVGNRNAAQQEIGYWNYYYSNGVLKSEGSYNDKNQREGTWKFYDRSGVIKDIENYVNGNVEGVVEAYYSNGSLKQGKNYVKGMLEGVQTIYYPTGAKENVYDFKANKKDGKESFYYKNGNRKYELSVVDGKYEGECALYYDDKHLMEKSTFKNDNRTGKVLNYYNLPENQLKSEANYEKGIITGEWKSYYVNGKVEETGSYDRDGLKTGVWKTFYDDNTLKSEENYSSGKNDGLEKYYDETGKLTEEFLYKKDILQEYKAYDPTGKIVYQSKKDGKNNYDVLLYYPNGNKRRECKITNGLLDGPWKDYGMDGYLLLEKFFKNGKKQGKETAYYENGKVKHETDYEDGVTNGFYKEYYKSGKLQREGAYINDKEVGVWKYYYENGNPEAVYFYNDGEVDGSQKYYAVNGKLDFEELIELGYIKKRISYDSTGKIFQQISFDRGTGEIDQKFPNGKQNKKYSLKNDIHVGNYVAYFPDGQIRETKSYADGDLQGEFKTFFPSGKLETVSTFVNGERHGKLLQYYEDGNVERETDYVYGDRTGKSFFYYPNKQIERDYTYKDGEITQSIFYNEAGELILQRNYRDGFLISYKYYDKTGNMITGPELKNETGTIKAFYKNGNPSIEFPLKNGSLDGKRIIYYSDGKIKEESNYSWDQRNGVTKYYYPSGKLKTEENWSGDEKDGKFTSYYENGKIKSEQYFVVGKEHGTSKYYDVNGKLTKTYVFYNNEMIDEK